MADARIPEADVSAVAMEAAEARVAEGDVSALSLITAEGRIAEGSISVLFAPFTSSGLQKADVSILAYRSRCVSRRAQLWRIERRDGLVQGFTSLDRDIEWGGVTYSACASLNPSASEASADFGQIGSVEIQGVISSDSIQEDELTAGLYDDAYLEVWEVPYDLPSADPQAPFRIAAGWTGNVAQGESDFKMEILGPGARLSQTALTDVIQPSCRWAFGVENDARCPVVTQALKIAGAVVTGSLGRGRIFAALVDPGPPAMFDGGSVHWLTGRNAGAKCEVDQVDFSADVVSLWKIAPFVPEVGDTFDLLPGCPKTGAACKTYGAYVDYGGFEDVPGDDAVQAQPPSHADQ